ncbi:CAP domain-containing protein [Shewanella salipaludis]|uniref:CAP domain-containing protein n=1 Tax=Shewanella salipaludis TaxID=2723052 RepID=A0A972FS91_9GAMM|nr:CAP domain-containing protein [Shewanella salipaludis]NMH65245.1 CAP domain-containing protein [Shewanella salipaludis]
MKHMTVLNLLIGGFFIALLASCGSVSDPPGGSVNNPSPTTPAIVASERNNSAPSGTTGRKIVPGSTPHGDYADNNQDTDLWSLRGWPLPVLTSGINYLSDPERQVLLHLNMVRADPGRYAKEFIEPRLKFFDAKLYREPGGPDNGGGLETQEGTTAVAEAVHALASTAPLGPLSPSHGMSLAAADHAADQSATGQTGHSGSDASSVDIRVERYGVWIHTLGENIVYGPGIGREIVVNLLIDDAVPDRGHRKNILNPDFAVVGVAIATHPKYGHICVIDFAGGFKEN